MHVSTEEMYAWLHSPPKPKPLWCCKECGEPEYFSKAFALTTGGLCMRCYKKSEKYKELQRWINNEFKRVMGGGNRCV